MKENILIIDGRGTEKIVPRKFEKTKVEKPPSVSPKSFSELLDTLETIQRKKKEFEFLREETTIKVENPTPFFYVCFLSDIHFDKATFNMTAFREYLEAIKNYPIYAVLVGDLSSFFSPTVIPRGMTEAVVNPDEQAVIARSFFKEYQEKILAMVVGNHEQFVRNASGIQLGRWLTEDLNIPLLKNGSMLHLQVNEQNYDIYLFHRIGRYYSSLNLTNSLRRALEMGKNADMVIQGHYEVGAAEKLVFRDKKPTLLQLGTFKTDDEYKRDKGLIPQSQIFFPVVRFRTDRKNIEITEDLSQALDEIQAIDHWYKMVAVGILGIRK